MTSFAKMMGILPMILIALLSHHHGTKKAYGTIGLALQSSYTISDGKYNLLHVWSAIGGTKIYFVKHLWFEHENMMIFLLQLNKLFHVPCYFPSSQSFEPPFSCTFNSFSSSFNPLNSTHSSSAWTNQDCKLWYLYPHWLCLKPNTYIIVMICFYSNNDIKWRQLNQPQILD